MSDLIERLRYPAFEHAGTAVMVEAADRIEALEADGREATRLLDLWSEIPDAEDFAPYQDTMTFLGKPNSVGWVWAREVREERDFDKEQARQRDLAMQCVCEAEEREQAAQARIEALEALLREARQYVSDAGGDEDCEVQQNSTALLIVIDAALAPEKDTGIGCGKSVIEPWSVQEPDGVRNLRAIMADQPYRNSGLSVHEIEVILANKGGFMPDEATAWFREARGKLGIAPETDAGIGCGKSVIEPWGTPEQNK